MGICAHVGEQEWTKPVANAHPEPNQEPLTLNFFPLSSCFSDQTKKPCNAFMHVSRALACLVDDNDRCFRGQNHYLKAAVVPAEVFIFRYREEEKLVTIRKQEVHIA